jgi:hypothetical protein
MTPSAVLGPKAMFSPDRLILKPLAMMREEGVDPSLPV